jgi:hypothetical protein
MEVSAFMKEQLKEQRDHDEKIRKEMEVKLEKQRLDADEKMEKMQEARFEQQRQEMEKMREASSAKAEAQAVRSCVSEAQLEALQARLDALHQAKLLTDDEVFKLEDCVAEFIECRSSLTVAAAQMGAAAEQVKKLVGLSEGVAKDGMLARQLRRRFA